MSIRIINLSAIRYSLLYLIFCMLSLVVMFSPHLGGKMVLLLQSNYL